MLVLIVIDILVGCTSIFAIVKNPKIYDSFERENIDNSSIVLLAIQKFMFTILVLTQLLEWGNFIMFLNF